MNNDVACTLLDLMCHYKASKDWLELIKDFIYVLGFITVARYVWTRNFNLKTAEIENNLRFRERIESALEDYVLEKHKNKIRDIGVRLVHWKNYPWKLKNDGYLHTLQVNIVDSNTIPYGWIDNTGIFFAEPVWFFGQSFYVDKNNIFFIAPKGLKIKNFKELTHKILVRHMSFTKIINYDFKERIEYEPIFYIKYPYTDENLYSDEYKIREKHGDEYFLLEVTRKKHLKKYSWARYKLLKLKLMLFYKSQK